MLCGIIGGIWFANLIASVLLGPITLIICLMFWGDRIKIIKRK